MIVRIIVRVKERASVRRLVHETRIEPVVVDSAKGTMAFDVPFRRVEVVLNRISRSAVAEFEAHLTPIPEAHDSTGQA